MQLSTYLFFNGRCEEALKFYEETLGARIDALMKHGGSPAEGSVPPEWRDKVMHARFTVGDSVLMASDAPPDHQERPQGFSMSISVSDKDKAESLFNKLAEDGTTKMPFQQTFWAAGFGMCVDRFGIPWMVNCEQGHE
jgi:PhnB protein